jgi:hypothetical protein
MPFDPSTVAKLPFVTAINGMVVGFDRCFFDHVGSHAASAAEELTKRAANLATHGGVPALLDPKLPRFSVRILTTITLQLPTAAAAEAECQRVNTAFRDWMSALTVGV